MNRNVYPLGRFPVLGDGKENRCSQQSQHCQDQFEFQCGQGFVDAPICIPYNLTCDGISQCPGKIQNNFKS